MEETAPDAIAAPDTAGGGSAAARAYREQLAREGQVLPDFVPGQLAGPSAAVSGEDARRDTRVKVSGRAMIRLAGGDRTSGRMVDLSRGGACVLMDDPLRTKTACTLEIDVFQTGKRQVFSCPAVCVYAVLAAGKGFKVGFQFGTCDAQARAAIASLLS